jgi:23S rRNA (uracil1939-C5)-methyltransferase
MGAENIITVERMAAGGLGLGRLDGRIVFLPFVLPGERVSVKIQSGKKDYFRAIPVEIIEAGPDRREPPCPLFGICGGCQIMQARYSAQMELKAGPALEKIGRPDRIVPSPYPLFYRDRVRFHLGMVGGRMRLGLYEAESNRLVPIPFCHQLNPRLNAILPALAEWTARFPEGQDAPLGLNLLVGRIEEGYGIELDFPGKPSDRMKALASTLPDLPGPVDLRFAARGRPVGSAARGGERGFTVLDLDKTGLRLAAAPGEFTQVNPSVNRLIVEDLVRRVEELSPKTVLDLYCGLGNLSLPLAGIAKRIVGVEESPAGAENARRNAKTNGLRNVDFQIGDSLKFAKRMAEKGDKFELVILDPPRTGARGLAVHIARLSPEAVVYVSCHPAAMLRDLAEFRSLGYGLKSLIAYDMFPQTAHLEAVAWLGRL